MYRTCFPAFFESYGCFKVFVVDVMDKRLDKALELGADAVINGAKEDTVARIRLTGGKGCDPGNRDCRNTDYFRTAYQSMEKRKHNCICRLQCKRRGYSANRYGTG